MAIAKVLRDRAPGASIAIVEKEAGVGRHASSRNSGVLHAGFYYAPGSLKARLTALGNIRLKEFCAEEGVPVNLTGKVVVARSKQDLPTLSLLYERGVANGVRLNLLTRSQLEDLDPNVRTFEQALYSPDTASVDPSQVCEALYRHLLKRGVEFYFQREFPDFPHPYRYLITCAGLQAVKIAHQFGVAEEYEIVPFKGSFFRYAGKVPPVRLSVYPVPHIKNPFLGVHFTVRWNGSVYIGPTATPVLSLENYAGLQGVRWREFFPLMKNHLLLWLRSPEYREIAWEELGNLWKSRIIAKARTLVHHLEEDPDLFVEEPAGIRAQLMDRRNGKLVMDFVILHHRNSTHILNAVSPAFTSSFAFAEHVVTEILQHQEGAHVIHTQ